MFCTKCGAKNPEDATFCYKCGNEMYKISEKSPKNLPNNNSVNNNEEERDKIKIAIEEEKGNPLAAFWGDVFDFNKKLGRRDFWAAVIIMAAINIIILALCLWLNFVPLWWVYNILFMVASISASVRRLHDTNRNGAFVLLNLIPFVGQIILLIMLLQKGETSSYVSPRWDGIMAMATIVLVIGGFLVGGVAYSGYQHQQEIQDEVSYDSDYDY